MRGEMRVLHYAAATEKAYVRWVKRFSGHVGSTELDQFDEKDIGTFLTSLAVEGNVSASTQTQAQSSLLFFYQCVIGKQLCLATSRCRGAVFGGLQDGPATRGDSQKRGTA
jgi:site-specific recombinase XerD